MPLSTLTSKGQTTIPKEIRDLLRIGTGDRIEFVVEGRNRVVLRPATADIRELAGLLHEPGRSTVSLDEMDAVIASGRSSTGSA